MKYAFRQDGYTDNAFVSGWFIADDLNNDGWITQVSTDGNPGNCGPRELKVIQVEFSGNSLVPAFRNTNASCLWESADFDNMVGVQYEIGAANPKFMGSVEWLPNPQRTLSYWQLTEKWQCDEYAFCAIVRNEGRADITSLQTQVWQQVTEPAMLPLVLMLTTFLMLKMKRQAE